MTTSTRNQPMYLDQLPNGSYFKIANKDSAIIKKLWDGETDKTFCAIQREYVPLETFLLKDTVVIPYTPS